MRPQEGFTLIEVMIVVVIVAILMAVAIPNYTAYVTRSKITEATTTLSDMRVKMEQYFQDNRKYTGACTAGTIAPLPDDTANFKFTCPVLTANTFTLQADGKGSMTGFTYTLDQNNAKTSSGPTGWTASTTCWIQKKDGSC